MFGLFRKLFKTDLESPSGNNSTSVVPAVNDPVKLNILIKAAGEGDADAQEELGQMYEDGRGIDQDESSAFHWYDKAAKNGKKEAQANLGIMYAEGRGIKQDHQKAYQWFLKAANQGHVGSQANIGVLYFHGHGVEEDNYTACVWISMAASQGDEVAEIYIDKLRKFMASEEMAEAEKDAEKMLCNMKIINNCTTASFKMGDIIKGRYKVQQIFGGEGKSGMGIVYIVKDKTTDGLMAAKTFQSWCFHDKNAIKMFQREAQIWINIGKHQNIVKAEYFLNISERPYLFMEYIDGFNLADVIHQGPVDIKQALVWSIHFCRGMVHAESMIPNIVHRDIKPENCLISRGCNGFCVNGIYYSLGILSSN